MGSGDTRRIALGAPMAAWRTVRRRMAGVLDASVGCTVGALLELPAEGWGEVWEVHGVQNVVDEEQWRKTKMGAPLSREWTESRPKPTDMVRGPGQVVPHPGHMTRFSRLAAFGTKYPVSGRYRRSGAGPG